MINKIIKKLKSYNYDIALLERQSDNEAYIIAQGLGRQHFHIKVFGPITYIGQKLGPFIDTKYDKGILITYAICTDNLENAIYKLSKCPYYGRYDLECLKVNNNFIQVPEDMFYHI